jgi:hypothetical protein
MWIRLSLDHSYGIAVLGKLNHLCYAKLILNILLGVSYRLQIATSLKMNRHQVAQLIGVNLLHTGFHASLVVTGTEVVCV